MKLAWVFLSLISSVPFRLLLCPDSYHPIPPLLPGSHRHSSSSYHLLNVQTRTQTSFCILSLSLKFTSITNPYSFSCPSVSRTLILPISASAIWFSLQPLQSLPNGFPCSLLMGSPDSSQSELSKNTIWSGYFPAWLLSFNGSLAPQDQGLFWPWLIESFWADSCLPFQHIYHCSPLISGALKKVNNVFFEYLLLFPSLSHSYWFIQASVVSLLPWLYHIPHTTRSKLHHNYLPVSLPRFWTLSRQGSCLDHYSVPSTLCAVSIM